MESCLSHMVSLVCIHIALPECTPGSRDCIRWFYSCDKSFYIRSVHSQCHVVLLKCTERNVNNQTLTQVSQLYVHVFFCVKVIRSWLNMPPGGHGHIMCMCEVTFDYSTIETHMLTTEKDRSKQISYMHLDGFIYY